MILEIEIKPGTEFYAADGVSVTLTCTYETAFVKASSLSFSWLKGFLNDVAISLLKMFYCCKPLLDFKHLLHILIFHFLIFCF